MANNLVIYTCRLLFDGYRSGKISVGETTEREMLGGGGGGVASDWIVGTMRSHLKKNILSGSHVEWVTLVLLALLNRVVSN
jgi:hypothetical protein